jgi:hypothetical protein
MKRARHSSVIFMKQYRKEWMLARDVVGFLKSKGFKVQRIESPKTGLGIPDLYFAKGDNQGWLELKLVKQIFTGTTVGIVWQPKQQEWLKEHGDVSAPCYTLIAYKDCFVLLEADRIYREKEALVNYDSGKTLAEVLL